jgi:hypothetical protein
MVSNVLQYWRNSTVDADRMNIDYQKVPCEEITTTEIIMGILNNKATKKLFALQKEEKNKENKEQNIIKVLVCPLKLRAKRLHGKKYSPYDEYIVPLYIPALLNKDGRLSFSDIPWIPRNLLEPVNNPITISTVQKVDDFLVKNEKTPESWPQALEFFRQMFQETVGVAFEEFTIEDYENVAGSVYLDNRVKGANLHVIKLYDLVLKETPPFF